MLDGGRANEQKPSDTAFASAADFRPVGRTDVQANARAASEPRVKTCSPTRPTTHWTSSSAPLSSPALPRSTPRPFLPVGTHRPLAVDALLHPGVHRRHPRSWADALLQNCAQSSDSRRPRRCCCRCSLRFHLHSCSRCLLRIATIARRTLSIVPSTLQETDRSRGLGWREIEPKSGE